MLRKRRYQELDLDTPRGSIRTRFYAAGGASAAILCVGGVGGGFDSPAAGLYPRLCEDLTQEGVSGLRVRFRDPRDLEEAVFDVERGIDLLHEKGIERVGLLGHSFGGAVVISAAVKAPEVKTIVTISSQSFGAEGASLLGERSLLLVHGSNDPILPPVCSESIYDRASGEKQLRIIHGGDHVLNAHGDEVYSVVRDWIVERLR